MKAIFKNATEHLGLFGVIATLGILALISLFVGGDKLQALVVGAGIWAPIVFVILKASTIIIAPLSGGPLYPIVGALFGFWPGLLYVVIGDFLGYTGAFFLARKFGAPFVEKLIAKNEQGLLKKVVEHAGTMKGFVHMILTFFAMPELICYGTGLSRFPYWKFIGILWPLSWLASALLVFAGAALGIGQGISFALLVPLVATLVIGLGIFLFVRGVQEKK